MRTRSWLAAASLILLIAGVAPSTVAADQVKVLKADQTVPMGTVTLEPFGSAESYDLVVTYAADDGWCLGPKTHLYVDLDEPTKMAPGEFPYMHEGLGCVSEDTYTVYGLNSCVWVAAHAETSQWSWPVGGLVHYYISFSGSKISYFRSWVNLDRLTNPDQWEVVDQPAWCLDLDHTIANGNHYNCSVTTSLDPYAPVDHPENLDIANYILWSYRAGDYNQCSESNPTPCLVNGNATWKDIQAAIWHYIQDGFDVDGPWKGSISWNRLRVWEIIADADANDDGWMPAGSDPILMIVKCGNKQVTAVEMGFDEVYVRGETAWAQGDTYPKKKRGWGSYWLYCYGDE